MLPIPKPFKAGFNIVPTDTPLSAFSGVISQLPPIHLLSSFWNFLDIAYAAASLPILWLWVSAFKDAFLGASEWLSHLRV